MAWFIVMLIYIVLLILNILISVGIGYLINWTLPKIGIGISIMSGILFINFSLYFFLKLMNKLNEYTDDCRILEDDNFIIRRDRTSNKKRKKK